MRSQINQNIIIRLAKPTDKNSIIKIQYNAIKILSAKDYNHQQLQALLKSKSTPRKAPETIFIAELNNQPVGFASLLYPPNTIGAVFVDPNYARNKIGTLLLEHLEKKAIEHKIPILWVLSSLTGYGFYQANNYQTINKTALLLYSTYIPCVQMKKRLLPVTKEEIIQEFSQLLAMFVIAIMLISFLGSLNQLLNL